MDDTRLSFAVLGAGAVGSWFGAMLARGGHDVVLIGRPAHAQAIERHGLQLEMRGATETVHLRAATMPDAVAGARCVLVCVKSADTESAARELRPHLTPGTLVLSLQNGVDNADRLREHLARPDCTVSATVVYVATDLPAPGHVRHHGRGELVMQAAPGAQAVQAAFAAAGVPVDVQPDVRGALWAKLVVNCAYNALSALGQIPYGRLVQQPGVAAVMRDVVAECIAVATADGITIPGDMAAAVRRIAETMPGQLSSTAQDLAKGKPTEIDHLNGHVARRGDALGVPTPVNRALWVALKLREAQAAAGGG